MSGEKDHHQFQSSNRSYDDEEGTTAKVLVNDSDRALLHWSKHDPAVSGQDNLRLLQGSKSDKHARESLARNFLGKICAIANKYTSGPDDFADLVQEGAIGALQAFEKFDEKRSHNLSAYAARIINQRMLTYSLERKGSIRFSRTMRDSRKEVYVTRQLLTAQLGREPSETEIARRAGLSIERVRAVDDSEKLMMVSSLDDVTVRRDSEVADEAYLSSNKNSLSETAAERNELALFVASLLNKLTAKEKQVILFRFGFYGDELTLAEIGRKLKISRQSVQQIEARAFKKLRRSEFQSTALELLGVIPKSSEEG